MLNPRLGELLILVVGLVLILRDFQPHNVLRRGGNESYFPRMKQTILRRRIPELHDGILLYLLGSGETLGELS